MSSIVCPHCGFIIPLKGVGAKAVVKIKGAAKPLIDPEAAAPTVAPKPKPIDILGELYDPYWALAKRFGATKNFKPLDSARAYADLIKQGWTTERIQTHAESYIRLTEDRKYLKQMVVWLESLTFQDHYPGDPDDSTASRLHARTRAT